MKQRVENLENNKIQNTWIIKLSVHLGQVSYGSIKLIDFPQIVNHTESCSCSSCTAVDSPGSAFTSLCLCHIIHILVLLRNFIDKVYRTRMTDIL